MNKPELMNSMEACKASLVERLMDYLLQAININF